VTLATGWPPISVIIGVPPMPQQLTILDEPPSELDRLRETLGIEFSNIDGARAEARTFRERLESHLYGLTSEDTSIVLFGSGPG
jgi:hypothetical protein